MRSNIIYALLICAVLCVPCIARDKGVMTFDQAKQRADKGDAFAQAVVAMHYQIGWETERNVKQAAKYALASAKANHAMGLFRVGSMLRNGEGFSKDEKKGLELQGMSYKALKDAKDPYSITAAAIMIFQGKVVGQNVSENERRRIAAALYKRAADMGYAPAQYNYAMALNDGHGVDKDPELFQQFLAKARNAAYPLAMSFQTQGSTSAIEGFTHGERWAYEFLEQKANPTITLASDSAGLVVFADAQHLVRSAEFRGTVEAGSIRTELSFYDARTTKLVCVVSLPNRVFRVGRVNGGRDDRFFIGTVTAAKYRYDDYPMAVALLDLQRRKLERVPLVADDYWLALNNNVELTSAGNILSVVVQPRLSSKYMKGQALLSEFNDIKLLIQEASRAAGAPYHHEINLSEHSAYLKKDPSGLFYFGTTPFQSQDPSVTRGMFAVNSIGLNAGPFQVLRAEGNGNVTRYDLSFLRSENFNTGESGAYNPYLFDDGTFACLSDGVLHLFRGWQRQQIQLPETIRQTGESMLHAYAYSPQVHSARPENVDSGKPEVKRVVMYAEHAVGYRAGDNFFRFDPLSDGGFQQVALSEVSLRGMRENIKCGALGKLDKEFTDSILQKPSQKLILDWNAVSNTFVVTDSGLDWFRVNADTGAVRGPLLSGGGKGLYLGVNYSNASSGWRAYSYISDSHTGGYSASINLESVVDGGESLSIANDLMDMSDPLAIQVTGERVRVLYGESDKLRLDEFNLSSKSRKDIKLWKFGSRFGKALCDHKTGTLFIPTVAGFEGWKIWDKIPFKQFDFIVGERDQYAIVLPNGSYAGSPGCERLLRLQAGNGTADGSTLASWRNRPVEVLKALGGDPEQIEILSKVTERWLKRIGHNASMPEPTAEEIPVVSVEMPPLWAKGSEIEVPIKITPRKAPIASVSVRVNGVECAKVLGQYLQKTDDVNLETVVSLRIAEGQNWIEVSATDEMGRRSDLQRFRTILKETGAAKRYIVALGVSIYQKSEYDLAFAAKDARDLSKAVGGNSLSLILTDQDVNGEALVKIEEFLSGSNEADEVILFCAGHGVLDQNLDYVFARHDFDPQRPSETGIKLDDLIQAVGSGKALKRLILLDTCHSGMVGEKDEALLAANDVKLPAGVRSSKHRGMAVTKAEDLSAGARQRFIEELFLLPGTRRGVNIIGASGGAEYALESGQWNNGVFTASVIEGLRDKKADWDKDQDVTVSELRDYLGQRIPELTDNAQKPSVVAFERDQDFILSR